MMEFAKFLGIDTFPSEHSLDNLAPVIDKIKASGYDLHVKGNYVSIWRNYPSRGYREIQFATNADVTEAHYECCLKFIRMMFPK